jgi:hypothetical protein
LTGVLGLDNDDVSDVGAGGNAGPASTQGSECDVEVGLRNGVLQSNINDGSKKIRQTGKVRLKAMLG